MRKDRHVIPAGRSADIELIRAGGTFRFRGPGGVVETAYTRGVTDDITGIPHVRYDLVVERPFLGRVLKGPKTLNLRSFLERYTERVQPALQAAE